MGRKIRDAIRQLSDGSDFVVDDALESWWFQVLKWPPDAFAVTSTLLGDSGAYRRAVSPPDGKSWPPQPETWARDVEENVKAWWQWVADSSPEGTTPPRLLALAKILRQRANVDVVAIAEDWELVCALLELHGLADEASGGFGVPEHPDDLKMPDAWQDYRSDANYLLSERQSLSKFSCEVIRIVPKLRTPQAGISLRSLSGHLASIRFPEVDVRCKLIKVFPDETSSLNLLLLPVPLAIEPKNFRPAPGPLNNMEANRFGFFAYEPAALDLAYVKRMLKAASECAGGVDGVLFPELSLSADELDEVKRTLAAEFRSQRKIPFVIAGVRKERANIAHFAVYEGGAWTAFEQAKHHRWSLDHGQIAAYRLGAALHPSIRWWEDISVERRELLFVLANSWLGICPLICEDLARQDPVSQIVRAIGPTLVVALLLDGPQLKGRWPGRYATVLADDPGSSVLTFTPLGMSLRSVPPGQSPRRTIGLWKDARGDTRELDLEEGAGGLLLTLCNEWTTEWIADGRSDGGNAAQLYLAHVEQIRDQPPVLSAADPGPTVVV